MTGKEANEHIGRVYAYNVPDSGLEILVKLDDWKQVFGRDLFLCIPVAGSGSTWLAWSSLKWPKEMDLRPSTNGQRGKR